MKRILQVTTAILLLLLLYPVYAQEYKPPHDNPGPAVDVVKFNAFAEEIAPAAIERGDVDIYLYSMRVSRVIPLEQSPDLRIIRAPSLSLSILLNPAPSTEKEFNPFSIPEVRQAVQYLINRDYVAREIYKGKAVPMVAHISPFEYDYVTIFNVVKDSGIRYDPELAKRMISDALTAVGAVMRDGKWYYNDNPIRVKFVIRTEDERREIGDSLAAELEKIGFEVERIYHRFAEAILRVYTTDPAEFQWHLYTEGWGKGALEKYDFGTINQMCAPWLGNMPGWREVGYWQYENPALDDMGQRLFKGEFSSKEERDRLYRDMTKLCIEESVRIWVATVLTSTPIDKDMQGVTEDLGAGARSLWLLRAAYLPGKNELKVGHLWVWTPRTVWNPIGGFNDVYSVDIWRNIYDPPITRHPFTGIPIPFRADFKVETAGPDGKLDVPGDAVMWDAESKTWKPVEAGTKAVSKVTFDYSKYVNAKWHHGIKISMADILYRIYQIFDIVNDPLKSKIEFALAATTKPILETFKGFRVVDDSTLEVYVDFWHFEESYIAEYAEFFGGAMPWEVLAAMDDVVFNKKLLMYSDTSAARFGVEQLSLVLREHATLVKRSLTEFLREKTFPENVFTVMGKKYETLDDALKRYNAAIEWFNERRHMVISNGPFMLSVFDPAAQYAELRAYRDPSYPFKPGSWYFGSPERVEVSLLEDQIKLGDTPTIAIEARGPGTLRAKYVLRDPASGEVMAEGVVELRAGRQDLRLAAQNLRPGFYQLSLLLFSEDISLVQEIEETVEAVIPMMEETTTTTTEVASPTLTQTTTAATTAAVEGEGGVQLTWIIAVVVVAIAAVAAVVMLRRRRA